MTVQSKISATLEDIGSINDLLIQILLHLPVKSLMRFKLVSKEWKSLICSHSFSRMYYPDPTQVVGFFHYGPKSSAFKYVPLDAQNPKPPVESRELKFGEDPSPFWIHHSCNGLLLCSSTRKLDIDNDYERSPISIFYVYNPTTNCFRKLPRPGVVNGVPRIVLGIILAFDPAKSPSFKVVCVRESEFDPHLRQIEIYSSESDEWRVSGEPFKAYAEFEKGVYCNGSIHWINYRVCEVLFFGVDQERLGKLPLPPITLDDHIFYSFYYFGESCDHLHLMLGYDELANVFAYEMKTDLSDWFVKYKIELKPAIDAAFPEIASHFPYICLLVRSMNESPFLVLEISHKVVRFNFECNTFEEICELEDGEFGSAHEYIQSLRMF